MTKQTHTPGPWRVRPNYFHEAGNLDGEENLQAIFAPSGPHMETSIATHIRTRDARLIAAAPDLLVSNEESQDMLYRVIPYLEDLGELETVYKNGAVAEMLRKVKAAIHNSEQAIAKAEGKGE